MEAEEARASEAAGAMAVDQTLEGMVAEEAEEDGAEGLEEVVEEEDGKDLHMTDHRKFCHFREH